MAPHPKLGQSESNAVSDGSAMRFLRAYRAVFGLPAQVHRDELDGENFYVFMRDLLGFMSSRPFPKYFNNDNFEHAPKDPADRTPIQVLTHGALAGYAGLILKQLRSDVYPDHPDFANLRAEEDRPQWWAELHI